MKRKKQKKGISLIVLVITIIVMIILASAVVISLNRSGMKEKSKDAIEKFDNKQLQELASLAWADAYADNVGKSTEELIPLLKESVENALAENNLNKEDYGIYVTEKGVEIAKGWLQTVDRTVVKGDTVLEIGADISYDETYGGTVTVKKDVDWKVLGAENGELLIMSTTDIESEIYIGGYDDNRVRTYLNEICAPYGKGAYATGARSITVEDVDRVTGYDKTQYGKGEIYEYGNIVTYSYNGTNKPAYSGTNGVSGTVVLEHNIGFTWWDLNYNQHYVTYIITNTTGVITDDDGVEAKIKNTGYSYTASSETDLKTKVPNAYNMLFGSSDDACYLLASSWCRCSIGGVDFGAFEVTERVCFYSAF